MTIRVFNFILAIVALTLLLIPILIIAVFVKLTSPGPVIHWSKRVGRNNNMFLMPKFRTMRIDTPQVSTDLLENIENYLTPIGSFLRKTSLDEIPQIIAVLQGTMMFVGPRPALFNQHDLIKLRTEEGVHNLFPGITGWAQINGRDELSVKEKVIFDKDYLEKRSILFDIKIILLTVYKVLKRADISH